MREGGAGVPYNGELAEFTSKSSMVVQGETFQFAFVCDLCDGSYITRPIRASSAKEALEQARLEARRHFNRCHCCGRWICDDHYNEDVMMCTACAPRIAARERTGDGDL